MFKAQINPKHKKSIINKNIYGHFSEHLGRCIYGGIWVGKDSDIPNIEGMRTDVIEALKEIKVPVLRWPGGCFADEYHWMDGIGDPDKRPTMINTHWGGVTENNHFGTHEFLRFCELIGAEPYINGNVGSGSVQEMSQWVEYMTCDGVSPMSDLRKENGREEPWKIKYFGVGNEAWGCGGNMKPEYYANEYRRYATYLRNYGENKIFRIAVGPNIEDYNWTKVLMREAGGMIDGLTLHKYFSPWPEHISATEFNEKEYFLTINLALSIDTTIKRHKTMMDVYDPDKRVALIVDEWGNWFNVEPGTNPGFLYQQNTVLDAVVAGSALNIFNNHSDRVRMANIAQMVNVLQAVILTEGDKLVKTPTYHIFNMYKEHQDATLIDCNILENSTYEYDNNKVSDVNISASTLEDGSVYVTLCNVNFNESCDVELEMLSQKFNDIKATIVTNDKANAFNDFDNPEVVTLKDFNDISIDNNMIKLTMPKHSVVGIKIR